MTVGELIEQLKGLDKNLPVHFAYNYGDYWKTVVAPEVSSIEEMPVKHSSYHNMPKLIEDDESGETISAIVLR